jgi:hypothetical protein
MNWLIQDLESVAKRSGTFVVFGEFFHMKILKIRRILGYINRTTDAEAEADAEPPISKIITSEITKDLLVARFVND